MRSATTAILQRVMRRYRCTGQNSLGSAEARATVHVIGNNIRQPQQAAGETELSLPGSPPAASQREVAYRLAAGLLSAASSLSCPAGRRPAAQ